MESDNRWKRKRGANADDAKKDLCRRCQSIDLGAVFVRNVTRKSGLHITHIGSIGPEMLRSTCGLCRLVATIFYKFSPEGQVGGAEVQYTLRLFSALTTVGELVSRRNIKSMPGIVETAVLGIAKVSTGDSQDSYREGKETYRTRTLDYLGYIYNSVAPEHYKRPRITARVVNPGKVDFDLAKEWLDFCHLHHKKTCTMQEHGHIQALRVIDCRTKSVIKAPQNCRYAAMSYVWGSQEKAFQNLRQLQETGLLPFDLPQVVEDAIEVVIRLGLCYLWVDKYCINQSDSADKWAQMSMMHLIYNHAVFTIVAAAGDDSSYGIAGISKDRITQPTAEIDGMTLVSTLPDPQKAVQASKWMTRAWVYQEALFSVRRLIFTEHQLYFECNNMHCHESINLPLKALHTADKRRFRTCFRHGIFRGGFGKRSWPLVQHIKNYSEKALTYETDILRGMMGIFSAFESDARFPIHQICGVPIEFDLDIAPWKKQPALRKQYFSRPWTLAASFARGLTWCLNKPAPRREGFPSWSWAGWTGPLRDWPSFELPTALENPEIRIWIELDDKLQDAHHCLQLQKKHALWSAGHALHVDAWTIDVEVSLKESGHRLPDENEDAEHGQRVLASIEDNGGNKIFSPLHLCEDLTDSPGGFERANGSDLKYIVLGYRKQACRSPIGILVRCTGDSACRIGLVDFLLAYTKSEGEWTQTFVDDRSLVRTRKRLKLL